MQSIPFHIAYLLTEHECVIVPGLGAFVVSACEKEKAKRWRILSPPMKFLGFNSEIKHNDGLLVNSVVKEKKCSYREAGLMIEKYVTDLLHSLNEGQTIHFPWVGSLHSSGNKSLFQPERTLSCNAFNYGFSGFSLPSVKDIEYRESAASENVSRKKKNREIVWIPVSRKFITYTGSIAAALIAICIIPAPLNNGPQYASILSLTTWEQKNVSLKTNIQIRPADTVAAPASNPVLNPEAANLPKANTYHYYIIIASLPNLESAKKTLIEFQSSGFGNAGVISSAERHRIYTNRFDDKAKAEKFLLQFRKDHPAQANAWLLKQKDV